MVQLPELCDENSEAYKAGYKNICEIGKERIRRAGEKIKSNESLPLENREKLDIGFKVFKLDSSNIKEWDTNTEDLQQTLLDSMENVKIDRSSLDILYEILLKYGLDLNIPIEENKDFYSMISEIRKTPKSYEILLVNGVIFRTDTDVTEKKYDDTYKAYDQIIRKEGPLTYIDLRFKDIYKK